MRKFGFMLAFALTVLPVFSKAAYNQKIPKDKPIVFKETWGYVVQSRVNAFSNDLPVTDLCYFSVDVDCYGELTGIPDKSKLPKNYKGRVHLVAICDGRSLTHFVLDPKYGVNKKIVDGLVEASKDYDGLQIDYELVPKKDAKHFRTFLKMLRKKLGKDKMLTICVPARTSDIKDDVYDYKTIAPYVDRIFVMAYDQHWSTSAPGPVAALDWSERIADYCLEAIPKEKFVMGMPFYGRTWQNTGYGKAWTNNGINDMMRENKLDIVRKKGIPYIEFKTQVRVRGYFDDAYSLVQRCKIMSGKGIDKIGFWRIGQEDPLFWKYLKVQKVQ